MTPTALKKWVSLLTFTLLVCMQFLIAPQALARVIFTTDEGTTNADTFIIDFDDSNAATIKLQFGDALDAFLQYDVVGDEFEINKNLNFQLNQAINFVIQRDTVLPAPATATGGQLFFDTDDDTLFYFSDEQNDWVALTASGGAAGNSDLLDGLDSTQFLRSDDSDNFTNGTITFDAGTTLDIDAGSNFTIDPTATTTIPETTSNTFTLDSDDTGGDVTLQFGETLSETLTFDDADARFEFSDDLEIQGDLDVTDVNAAGNLDVTGNTQIDGDLNTDGNSTLNGDTTIGDNAADTIIINSTLSGSFNFGQNEAVNLVIETGVAFPLTPVAGQKFFRTDLGQEFVFDGVEWVSTSSATGSGRLLIFAAEYEDATIFGDGTANRGTLSADHDDANDRNFYRWQTGRTTIQDYDIVLQIHIPEDFVQFPTNALSIQYLTDTLLITDSQIDISMEDSTGAAVTLGGDTTDLSTAGTWDEAIIDIQSGTFTPGEYATLFIKLHARRDALNNRQGSQTGEIELQYLAN